MSVVGLFVICNSFQFTYYQAFRSSNVMFVLSYFVATVNSSVNSVVYGIFSKKYREVFLEHFWCKKPVQAKIEMRTVITTKKQLISHPTSTNQQSADEGLMIRSSVPEEPMG